MMVEVTIFVDLNSPPPVCHTFDVNADFGVDTSDNFCNVLNSLIKNFPKAIIKLIHKIIKIIHEIQNFNYKLFDIIRITSI